MQATLPISGRVYSDTSIIVYTVERHPTYAPVLKPLWEAVAGKRAVAATSEFTLMEVLVQPFADDLVGLQVDYEAFMRPPNVELVPVSRRVLVLAAQIRAAYPQVRGPDAVQLATAVDNGCDAFLTNDRRLEKVDYLSVVYLDRLVQRP